jgi:8-oxo-dGTP diphosphatase
MKTIKVVVAIIRDGDQIFATQRGYGDFKDGWEFPGGKVEPGESPEEAIIREIKEELNCDIKINKFLLTIEYTYPTFHLIMHCYLCNLLSEFTLLEHADYQWLDKNTLRDVEWLEADIEVVDYLLRRLSYE